MTERLWRQNVVSDLSFRPSDLLLALDGADIAGFVLTKRYRESAPQNDLYRTAGWIAALAVHPAWQGRGIGRRLLVEAERDLWADGAAQILAGGNIRVFFPGVPDGYPAARHLFESAGYVGFSTEYDLAGDLIPDVFEKAVVQVSGVTYRQMQVGDAVAALSFITKTFPGRWSYSFDQYLRDGGDPTAVTLSFDKNEQIVGFLMTYDDTNRVIGAPFMWVADRPAWSGIGPLGLDPHVRGGGAGLGLVAAGMRHLYGRGLRHARIDWTTLLDFYGRLGFAPVARYWRSRKERGEA